VVDVVRSAGLRSADVRTPVYPARLRWHWARRCASAGGCLSAPSG